MSPKPASIEEKKQDAKLETHDSVSTSSVASPLKLTEEQEVRLWRKIDRRLMPILLDLLIRGFLIGNIGNARFQGLVTELELVGNQYNIALTMYFIVSTNPTRSWTPFLNLSYCIFECPSNLVLKKFRPRIWLPGITAHFLLIPMHILILTGRTGPMRTLMGLVENYPQLVVGRVLLGIAEAGLFPGVVYYLTLWYPRHMLQFRIGLFFGAATLAGAFSGLFTFGISFMSGTRGLLGWSWIFILEGIATVAVGLVAFIVLVDFPDTASFLTPEERAFVVWKKKYDNSGVGEEERFSVKYIIQAFTG
ncbi:hypothetical protein PM082_024556 [Marasmius tenuissimus]|nr:hypothetical protein PM082_024556 [Marasmius tenuissimus]